MSLLERNLTQNSVSYKDNLLVHFLRSPGASTGFRDGCLEGLINVIKALSVSIAQLAFFSSRLAPAATGFHAMVSEAAMSVQKKDSHFLCLDHVSPPPRHLCPGHEVHSNL